MVKVEFCRPFPKGLNLELGCCKKYNYLEVPNGVVIGKNYVLRGSAWCYANFYEFYMIYTYYILNLNNNMEPR